MNRISISSKGIIAIGILLALVIALILYVNVRAGDAFANCAQLKQATNRSAIVSGDKLYSPALDRDRDGIACE